MKYEALREEVCRVNQELVAAGLVVLTWGNASGVDRTRAFLARARRQAKKEKLDVEFVLTDMRKFRRPRAFDAVTDPSRSIEP